MNSRVRYYEDMSKIRVAMGQQANKQARHCMHQTLKQATSDARALIEHALLYCGLSDSTQQLQRSVRRISNGSIQ